MNNYNHKQCYWYHDKCYCVDMVAAYHILYWTYYNMNQYVLYWDMEVDKMRSIFD